MVGEPAVMAERVGNSRAYGFFAASSDVLIHRSPIAHVAQLTWVDRRGRSLGNLGTPADFYDNSPRVSPDGSKIALTRAGTESTDVWVHDLSRDVSQRLTFEPSIDQEAIWAPDGTKLVFSSSRKGHFDLYRMSSNGDGGPELLYASRENKYATSWSSDGRFLLFNTEGRGGISILPLESAGNRTPISWSPSQSHERSGVFSPDSRWISYVSDESGQPEVYAQPFVYPLPPLPGAKVLISRGGGTSPHWRADGKEIFYRAADGTLMAVSLTTDTTMRPGVPKTLFRSDRLWTVTGDGNRFLVSVPVDQGKPPFTVVLNWQSSLQN
jgi:Tol biopolymer transport system component